MAYFRAGKYRKRWAVYREGYSFPYMYPYPKYSKLTEPEAKAEAKRLNNERKGKSNRKD